MDHPRSERRAGLRRRILVLLMAAGFLGAPLLAQAVEICVGCCCAAMADAAPAEDCGESLVKGDCCEVDAATGRRPAERAAPSIEAGDRPEATLQPPPPRPDPTVARLASWPSARLSHLVSPLRRSVVLLI